MAPQQNPRKLVKYEPRKLSKTGRSMVPALIADAGERASRRFVECFTAEIRNRNTRLAYGRAVLPFLEWCEVRGRELHEVDPVMVAAYIEELGQRVNPKTTGPVSRPTVKQHLAVIRRLFDYLVTGGVLPFNPAASVRGPKYKIKRGKTPVLNASEITLFLHSIDTQTLVGLRDRALIGTMLYTFARLSAVVAMRVEDYHQEGTRWSVRLHGVKGGVNLDHFGGAKVDQLVKG